MKPIKPVQFLFILICLGLLSACQGTPQFENKDTLYQVSTIQSLLAGNYGGIDDFKTLSQYGDFGIGTFHDLDGEMLLLDGVLYQVNYAGEVLTPVDPITFPFAAVTFFEADKTVSLGEISDLETLFTQIDQNRPDENQFYAIRISGVFNTVKVRSVPKQEQPYPPLSEVTANQSVFEYAQVEGDLIGFWCPDYVGGINVPGYHLHFLSKDHTMGGHLLDVQLNQAELTLDATDQFALKLATGSLAEANFDVQEEIDKVEK